jgi:hypothetical protein
MSSLAAVRWGRALLAAAGPGRARLPAGWPGHGPQARLAVGQDWADSGVLALTGRAGGEPVMPDGAAATAARGAGLALAEVSGRLGAPVVVDGGQLLGERAALRGLSRRGEVSASGTSRLLRTADGRVALTLGRAADTERIPALVSGPVAEPWEAARQWLAGQSGQTARERAGLLGLALGVVPRGPAEAVWPPWRVTRVTAASGSGRPWRVADLSSLWAGPLCGNLLHLAGLEVVKVESTGRPDGARGGDPGFYDLLNAGKAAVAVDFAAPGGRRDLARLLDGCDVVIEASRPRALEQLGIVAADWVAARPGRVWLSLTAYGRDAGHRAGYGDDAAAEAGVLGGDDGGVVFAGDAIADPLAGLHAAVLVLALLAGGRGGLADVPMARVARATLRGRGSPCAARAPTARAAAGRAAAAGADNDRFLRAGPC